MSKPTERPTLTKEEQEERDFYESDLWEFAKYINPLYEYGEIHKDVFRALQQEDDDYLLFLLPRGHLKSHCVAVYCAWAITREPTVTIAYLTAGESLAKLQMAAIKGMLESKQHRLLWPELIHAKESDRDKWSTEEINVDHPARSEYGIRDYTLVIKTIGSSAGGMHCDKLIMDDVVVQTNAYSEAKRKEVETSVSDYASIKNPGCRTVAVGTLYHEKDVWHQFMAAMLPVIDDETGEVIEEVPLWKVIRHEVEDKGDMRGTYLWPRVKSAKTGKWYGFDLKTLLKKRAEYLTLNNAAQFHSQYYNDTNRKEADEETTFQYYNRSLLTRVGDTWYYQEKELTVVAGMDLAWTEDTGRSSRGDYSAIAVIGMDEEGFIYLLDLVRFKTAKYSVYYRHISRMYDTWRFRRLFIEQEGGGKFVVGEMQDRVRNDVHINLTIIGKNVPRSMSKEERITAILEPRYDAGTIKHFKGGMIGDLELELNQLRPKFDDLKDALSTAVKNAKRPKTARRKTTHQAPAAARPSTVPGLGFGGRRR